MKRIIALIFLFILCASTACAYEFNYLPIESINIGNTLIRVRDELKKADIIYEEFKEDQDKLTFIATFLNIFGLECQNATLAFTPDGRLFYINASPRTGDFNSAYIAFTSNLGNAHRFHIPYIDYDTDQESYINYILPVELSWDIDGVSYEMCMYADIYTEVKSSLFNGTEIIEDNEPKESIEFYIYAPTLVNKYF